MEIVRRVHSMREISTKARNSGLRVGLVPTMGALHEGHLSLISYLNEVADTVVVSIFVNPTQFGPDEDLAAYPRELTRDADLCIDLGVDYIFAPEAPAIYPPGPPVIVEVSELGERLEGAARPGHFRGVATVVLKLFNVIRPHVAAFGQKDAQQALIVRRMVQDLLLDVEIAVRPIVRDPDGLALSSRNRWLSPGQRRAAGAIPRCLEAARAVVLVGETAAGPILAAARAVIDAEPGLRLDYLELVSGTTLEPVERIAQGSLLLVAAHCGEIRLLDNVVLEPVATGTEARRA